MCDEESAPADGDVALQEFLALARERGDPTIDALICRFWPDIHREARRLIRREQGATLQATELMSMAFLRLRSARGVDWSGNHHVFRTFARAMRRVLIDEAKRRCSLKRGGGAEIVTLGTVPQATAVSIEEMIALDDALAALASGTDVMRRQAQVLELVFFGGASLTEVSESLGISERQVRRDWSYARVWLRRRIGV